MQQEQPPPPPPPLPDDLRRFLERHPQYREHVFWSERHRGYAMPAWLGDELRLWFEAQAHPPGDN